MNSKVFYIKTNYEDFCRKFLRQELMLKKDSEKTTREQLSLDFPRAAFLSRQHTLADIKARWLPEEAEGENTPKPQISLSFSQGNIVGNVLTKAAVGNMFAANELTNKHSNNDGTLLINLGMHDKEIFFGYINNKGEECALSIGFNDLEPSFFNICHIRNTITKDPKDREVISIQSTNHSPAKEKSEAEWPKLDNVSENQHINFPSLEYLAHDAYQDGELIERKEIINALLNIEDLPEEVIYCLLDVINHDGHLNTTNIGILQVVNSGDREGHIVTDSVNSGIKFESEKKYHQTILPFYSEIRKIEEELDTLNAKAEELRNRGEPQASTELREIVHTMRSQLVRVKTYGIDHVQDLITTSENIQENIPKSTLNNSRGLGKILDGLLALIQQLAKVCGLEHTENAIKEHRKSRIESLRMLGTFSDNVKNLKEKTQQLRQTEQKSDEEEEENKEKSPSSPHNGSSS